MPNSSMIKEESLSPWKNLFACCATPSIISDSAGIRVQC
jgi:hypothetical protein